MHGTHALSIRLDLRRHSLLLFVAHLAALYLAVMILGNVASSVAPRLSTGAFAWRPIKSSKAGAG
jgi:hypothetical protein